MQAVAGRGRLNVVDEATVRRLIDHYLQSRKRDHDYASISAAARALEETIGMEAIETSLLHEWIAEHAVAHGLAVDFDGGDAASPDGKGGGNPK